MKPAEQWRKTRDNEAPPFPIFLPSLFLEESGIKKSSSRWTWLHLNRTDNLWQSARGEILWAIKRSLWAYNVTYSPCNFAEWMQEWLHRIERARRIFFVLAARRFVLKSVSKEFHGAASLGPKDYGAGSPGRFAPHGPRNSRVSARRC